MVTPQMNAMLTIATAVTAAYLAAPASAQDIDAGEKLYKKECRACHGPSAKGVSSAPGLAGKPADYLTQRLKQYRAGERLGPNAPLMAPRAKKLSDDDISNVFHFLVTTFE